MAANASGIGKKCVVSLPAAALALQDLAIGGGNISFHNLLAGRLFLPSGESASGLPLEGKHKPPPLDLESIKCAKTPEEHRAAMKEKAAEDLLELDQRVNELVKSILSKQKLSGKEAYFEIDHPRKPKERRRIAGNFVEETIGEWTTEEFKKAREKMQLLEYRLYTKEELSKKLPKHLEDALKQIDEPQEEFTRICEQLQNHPNLDLGKIECGIFPTGGCFVSAIANGKRLDHRYLRVNEDVCTSVTFKYSIDEKTSIPLQLRGVFDGHGGADVAKILPRLLPNAIVRRLQIHNGKEPLSLDAMVNACTLSPVDISREVVREDSDAGSCANFSLECKIGNQKHIIIGNVADSSCIALPLKGDLICAQLSEDMRLPDPYIWLQHQQFSTLYARFFETAKKVQDGASAAEEIKLQKEFDEEFKWMRNVIRRDIVLSWDQYEGRINGLNIPRTIGDKMEFSSGQQLSARAKVTVVTRGDLARIFKRPAEDVKEVLFMHMSDGITDVASKGQIATLFRSLLDQGLSMQEAAQRVVFTAKKAGSTDDCTLLVYPVTFA